MATNRSAETANRIKPLSTNEWYVTNTAQFNVLSERLEIARNVIEGHRAYINQLQYENRVLKVKLAKLAKIEAEYTKLQVQVAQSAISGDN